MLQLIHMIIRLYEDLVKTSVVKYDLPLMINLPNVEYKVYFDNMYIIVFTSKSNLLAISLRSREGEIISHFAYYPNNFEGIIE